jgi:anti-repressor protein
MSKLTVFNNPTFGQLRAFLVDDGPWFVAKDVCGVLGYTNVSKAIADHVDMGDKLNNETLLSLGQRGGWLINESGLYSLIMTSKMPNARVFKHWVTHDVLPTIRRTGGYLAARADDTPEDILALALRVADATIKRREERIRLLESERRELMPKASFYDAVADSDDTILIGELAKLMRQNGIGIGQNRLFAWMRENGYLGKYGSHRNIPTQYAMDMELFRIKESTIPRSDGSSMIKRTPRVTGKGQAYFLKKLKEEWL